jgi:hypothetical protein
MGTPKMPRLRRTPARRGLIIYVGLAFAVAMLLAATASANTPVPHASFTTTNTSVDGTGHCQNGNEAVNCNIYDGKQYVWLNGGPVQGQLDNGTYVFAVLVPGGQGGNENPNDCTTNNLSDLTPCDTSSTGAGDTWTHRVFSISDHVMTYPAAGYPGGHDFSNNEIRLMPYDDTTNPGGVYIMAICSLVDATNADLSADEATAPPGVDASDCKYDAFKVQGQGQPPASPLTIAKTAQGSYDRECDWTITKSADPASKTVDAGQSATFNYTVTVAATCTRIENVEVDGNITVTNPNASSVDITSLVDQLSGGTDCTITPSPPSSVAAGDSAFTYGCDLPDGSVPTGLTNTATVSWDSQLLDDGSFLVGDTKSDTVDVPFTGTLTDDCVSVADDLAGNLGSFCAPDASGGSQTFTYSLTFYGPAASTCADHTNTATFTDNSTPVNSNSASATVRACSFGPRFTPGYWKNHLANSNPLGLYFDSACTKLPSPLPSGTSCSSNSPWVKQDLTKKLGNFSVSTIIIAAKVWSAMSCSLSGNAANQNQQAIGCLAGHLLAAKYNRNINNSNPCIDSVIGKADTFLTNPPLTSVTFGGYTANSINYTGPTGSYTGISTAQRNLAIALKSALDAYNNGGYCH